MWRRRSRKRKDRSRRRFFVLLLLCAVLLSACGDDEEDLYDFSGREPKEIDPWVYIQDTAISTSAEIRGFASSAGDLAVTVGVMGIVFSILYMCLRILFAGNARARSEVKEEAVLKGLIAIMLFSIPLWLGLCKMVSEMLV
ncbi:hypothetical protein [uncultured Acetatifactor sp.]|uniref:hypothetical protein n=1 Tax=uncultured Acetatifactor sp. TaxID=1671927 RepID=UPI0025AA1686|nr:hypothetical protein [uncultured Acetatifactor sp.]